MIRVGFILNISEDWIGGLNYMKNLFYAIKNFPETEVQPIVFINKNTNLKIKEEFRNLAEVVELSLWDKRNLIGILWAISRRITNSDFFIEIILRKYKISVFSHSRLKKLIKAKTINWIPDFQHIYLPEMFSSDEIKIRNKYYLKLVKGSDIIILSSIVAYNHFQKSFYNFKEKARILPFVSQPGNYFSFKPDKILILKGKYNISDNYFFIPNQFWKHKNHKIVFESLKILKDSGNNIQVVCSGLLKDHRNLNYSNELKHYVEENNLDVILLGQIEYEEIITLMKASLAVINPSLFEGWSSTVEECKSLGKNMILSDIPVHKEQNPINAVFFNPNNPNELANIMLNHITDPKRYISLYNELEFHQNIDRRTKEYALNYKMIIKDVFS
jgi:glycosyltransferase involved in cell wall biosynthesis